jgi:hypothetical protein
VSFEKLGKYKVEAIYSSSGGGKFELKLGDASLVADTQNTGGFENYQETTLGFIEVTSTNAQTLSLKAISFKSALGNFKGLRFTLEP